MCGLGIRQGIWVLRQFGQILSEETPSSRRAARMVADLRSLSPKVKRITESSCQLKPNDPRIRIGHSFTERRLI